VAMPMREDGGVVVDVLIAPCVVLSGKLRAVDKMLSIVAIELLFFSSNLHALPIYLEAAASHAIERSSRFNLSNSRLFYVCNFTNLLFSLSNKIGRRRMSLEERRFCF